MAQTILDDGINVMGSGSTPPGPDPTPVTLSEPTEGATVALPFDVSGTAAPGSSVLVKIGIQSNAADVDTVTAGVGGAWTLTITEWPPQLATPVDGSTVLIYARDPADSANQSQVAVTASVPAVEGLAQQHADVVQPDTIDPSNYTVAQVQSYLAMHPEDTDAVLAAERAGKNRSTLVNTEEN